MSPAVNCPFCGAGFEALPGQSATCSSCQGVFVPSGTSSPQDMPPPGSSPVSTTGEKACPMCGETIKALAVICRYCKAQVGNPPASSPQPQAYAATNPGVSLPAMPKKKSSWLMWTLIIGGVFLLCCGIGVVGMLVSAPEITREGCQQNLAWLANEARLQKESLDEFQGRDLWVHVSRSQPGKEYCPGTIIWKFEPRSYLGPQKPYSECGEEDPVAACPKEGHEEGRFVLYKNGIHEFVPKSDPKYEEIFKQLME